MAAVALVVAFLALAIASLGVIVVLTWIHRRGSDLGSDHARKRCLHQVEFELRHNKFTT